MENPASKGASMASVQGPTGVVTGRGMCEEKRKMNRFSIVGTLNSGGPESEPEDAEGYPKADCDQPIEDAIWTLRESDPPIVVRDGNAGHKAKEWAGWQRKHSTHNGPCRSRQNVSSSLLALGTDSSTLCVSWFHLRVILRSPVR